MTAAQIVYRAWQNAAKPILYATRDDKGNEKIVACDFADPLKNKDYTADWHGECLICGANSEGGIPQAKLLGSSYTDGDKHKRPESDHICASCLFCMGMNVAAGRMTLFRYSFLASDAGLEICNRKQMRDRLLDPPDPPFVAVVAVSQKKHLATKSHVSYSRDQYVCMLEEEPVYVIRPELEQCVLTIEALRALGATKDEIKARNFRFERAREWGMDNLQRAIDRLGPCVRNPRMFELALHVAQKNDSEEDARCFMGFTPKT